MHANCSYKLGVPSELTRKTTFQEQQGRFFNGPFALWDVSHPSQSIAQAAESSLYAGKPSLFLKSLPFHDTSWPAQRDSKCVCARFSQRQAIHRPDTSFNTSYNFHSFQPQELNFLATNQVLKHTGNDFFFFSNVKTKQIIFLLLLNATLLLSKYSQGDICNISPSETKPARAKHVLKKELTVWQSHFHHAGLRSTFLRLPGIP